MQPQGTASANWLSHLTSLVFYLTLLGSVFLIIEDRSITNIAIVAFGVFAAYLGLLFARVIVANNKMLAFLVSDQDTQAPITESQRLNEALKKAKARKANQS